MRTKIVICLNPYISHFIPTIEIAKQLEKTNDIIYVGFKETQKCVVEENFNYILIENYNSNDYHTLIKNKEYAKAEEWIKSFHKELLLIFNSVNPDYVLFGASKFVLYFLPAYYCGAKIVQMVFCAGNLLFNFEEPPLTSSIKINNRNQTFKILFAWLFRLMRVLKKNKILFLKATYPYNKMYNLYLNKRINFNLSFDGVYLDYPILSFGTELFSFFEKNNFINLGLCTDINRRCLNDKKNFSYNKGNKKLIYCSFGTLNHKYKNTTDFIHNLIKVFENHKDWDLILNVENNKLEYTNLLPKNIFVFPKVPQLKILELADVMITHGGYSSVKECIYFNVPMLVCPCRYDQFGNAAIVEYKKIGLRYTKLKEKKYRNKKTTDENAISSLLSELLNNNLYKENIKNFRYNIIKRNEIEGLKKIFNLEELI